MKRKTTLDRIAELLARFTAEVKTLNKNGLYDINLHAEDVLVPIINLAFDVDVVNANKEEKNAAAIDLVDKLNRIAFQVTSTADSVKVKHTLAQFVKYEKYKHYDVLFIYIISDKQKIYSGKGYAEIIDNTFEFNKNDHIIDNGDLLNIISRSYGGQKINTLKDILEEEFTDEKIEVRKHRTETQSILVTERIYSNLLELSLPSNLYIATLNINRDQIIKESWETEYKLKMKSSTRAVTRRALGNLDRGYYRDWHVYEKQLITFRDLNDSDEPLSKLIDTGTVEIISCDEYQSIGGKYVNIFAELIKYSFQQLAIQKRVKFSDQDEFFFYLLPKSNKRKGRKITWKSTKRTSTRSVVLPKIDANGKLLYYRHLAFRANFIKISRSWYVVVNPTYLFTTNGYQKSKFHVHNLKGIKRLENNQAVRNSVQFLSFHLGTRLPREKLYEYLEIGSPEWDEITFQSENFK